MIVSPKQFLDLVEIRVVIPSVAPLLVGLAYSQWRYQLTNWVNTILLVIAAVCVHLAVNTFNRYEDHHRQKNSVYLRNSAKGEDISDQAVLMVAIILAGIAGLAGISVAIRTSYVTWVIGIVSFLIGYLYSAGPKPITNTPFGELVSGVTMGYFIFVAQVYVNTMIKLTPMILFQWFMVILPITLLIANIMLANNIADHQEDEENNRHTIVHYLGQENAKKLYWSCALLAYLEIIMVVICHWLPISSLAMLALFPLMIKNTRGFTQRPVKSETFVLSVKNLLMTMLALTLTIWAGLWL